MNVTEHLVRSSILKAPIQSAVMNRERGHKATSAGDKNASSGLKTHAHSCAGVKEPRNP